MESFGQLYLLDTSEMQQTYLLESNGGARLRLSATANLILERAWSNKTFEEIASELRGHGLSEADSVHVETCYTEIHRKVIAAESRTGMTESGHLLKFVLIPQKVVGIIAPAFSFLFTRIAGVAVVAMIIAGMLEWLRMSAVHQAAHPQPLAYVVGYLLFFVSLVFHEFGHAGASSRFGQKPGAIGFTLYLTLPALYADVTSTWRLSRMQRVIVDAAGTYVQLAVASIYVALYVCTGRYEFHVAVFMILAVSLFNLNPLFKFDGYWIVADALGITNLSRQVPRIMRSITSRFLGRGPGEVLPWPAATVRILAVYSALAVVAWGYFLWRLVYSISHQSSAVLKTVVAVYVNGSPFTHEMMWQTVIVVGSLGLSAFFVSRLIMSQIGYVSRLIRSAFNARTLAITGGTIDEA